MTTTTAASSPGSSQRTLSGPWGPLLSLLLLVTLLGVGAILIDFSSLDQGPDSWGYVFVFVVVTAFYAVWPLLGTLVCGIVAVAAGPGPTARAATIIGTVIAAALGVCGLVAAVAALASARYEADYVSVPVLLVASAPPLLLAASAVRRSRSRR